MGDEARDAVFSMDDDGDIVFSDDVKTPDRIAKFLKAAGDVNYVPLPMDGEGPYPTLEETDLTLLHWAAWYKELDTIKLLIQYGAKIGVKDVKGNTPLDLAKQQKADKPILDLLSASNNRASLRVGAFQ